MHVAGLVIPARPVYACMASEAGRPQTRRLAAAFARFDSQETATRFCGA